MGFWLTSTLKRAKRNYNVTRAVARHPLHRKRPVRSVLKWWRTLIAIKLAPTHEITIPYVGGAVLHWPAAATSVMICARYGLGEYADMAFCLHVLRDTDIFCDVGANAGVYTVLAARVVGCRVVAIEPIPRTFDLLMQNVYANGIADRVDARCNGVGRESGSLRFTSSLWSYNHVVKVGDDDTTEVEVMTLDALLDGRLPTVIKIDVEGFEANVLRGGAQTFRNPALRAVVIEMTDHVLQYGDTLEGIREMLSSAGLDGPYGYDPAERQLAAIGKRGPTKYNEIYVRDINEVSTRVKESQSYEVHGASV